MPPLLPESVIAGEPLTLTRQAEYLAWFDMIRRCTDPRMPTFRHYGARGIRVCDRWLGSFGTFLKDMGKRPSKCYSLDRIDNNGNYEPGNCRWATRAEQNRNRRDTHTLTYAGKSQCVKDWAKETGIPNATIHARLARGWPIARVLSTPPRSQSRPTVRDMVGLQFGRIMVQERAPNNCKGNAMWRCVCECGRMIVANGYHLRSGNTKSCGCLRGKGAKDA